MDLKLFIVISAVGVPALMIGLGWFEQMTGNAINNLGMISAGNGWMMVGALIYIIELIIGVYLALRD